ncbi:MAG: GIY-YIG nuclease family protein, partial [Alistipes sp.]|nr:GIY-YIG nuclease family protein [Alistipes sp.]
MEDNSRSELKEQVSLLPLLPGCYLFSDKSGQIIYVGKAKSLKKRVSSYFVNSRDHSAKVRAMVRQIASLQYIVVDSETDALLLENSLIKSHKPRYNILLKDDKSYPWIALTPPPFERVISTRRVVKDGSRYFGPYASISAQRAVLEFISEVIPLRTCRYNLSQELIDRGKYAPCLQYHIG